MSTETLVNGVTAQAENSQENRVVTLAENTFEQAMRNLNLTYNINISGPRSTVNQVVDLSDVNVKSLEDAWTNEVTNNYSTYVKMNNTRRVSNCERFVERQLNAIALQRVNRNVRQALVNFASN